MAIDDMPGAVDDRVVPGAVDDMPGAVDDMPGAVDDRVVPGAVDDMPGAVDDMPGAVDDRDVPGAVDDRDVPGAVDDMPGAVDDNPGTVDDRGVLTDVLYLQPGIGMLRQACFATERILLSTLPAHSPSFVSECRPKFSTAFLVLFVCCCFCFLILADDVSVLCL